jgi:hypothetical protein
LFKQVKAANTVLRGEGEGPNRKLAASCRSKAITQNKKRTPMQNMFRLQLQGNAAGLLSVTWILASYPASIISPLDLISINPHLFLT